MSTELAQAAAWLPDESDARVTYLFGVANLDGDSDDALRDVLRTVPPDSWRVLDLDLRIGDGLLLLHAANRSDEVRVWPARTLEVPERGAVIGEALAQPMVPGRYELASAEIHTPAGDFAAIARFTLQEPAA